MSKEYNGKFIMKLMLMLSVLIIGIFILRGTTFYQNLTDLFTNQQKITNYLESYGRIGPIIFFILQVLQVIVSPIPGNITTILGGNIFGLADGLVLNISSIFIGSILAYMLARTFGHKLVLKFIGENNYNKYIGLFNKKQKLVLLVIFLLPFFPDDMFCFLAGLSLLSIRSYIILLIVGRLPVIAIQTILGSGLLKLNQTTYLIVGGVAIVLGVILYRYKDVIEGWLYKRVDQAL